MRLDEAIEFAQAGYKPGRRMNMFTRDLVDIEASTASSICACRGMCGSHTGPCSMQSSKEAKGTKMCKACATAISAGGPGSGRKPGSGGRLMTPKDAPLMGKYNKAYNLFDKHAEKSEIHDDKAQDAKDKDKAKMHQNLSNLHDRISKHFDNAARFYDAGDEKGGDKHFAKGMALRQSLKK